MNFKLGLLVVAVVAILIGAGFKANKPVLRSELELTKPWIEVAVQGVFELAEDQKTEKRELFTGDELENGAVVGVREGALANIYFPDGSVARLDSGTRLKVESGDFDGKTNKLNVRLNLLWGRVWSKVITVLTPESVWEVKTTNAVAVVRGTAFGVEYIEEGKSNVVGYENKVEVKLIDPETKKIMPAVAMIVEAKKSLEVTKSAIENMKTHIASGELSKAASAVATKVATKAGQPIMEVKQASEKVLSQNWVKRGISADEKLNQKIRDMKEKIQDQREAVKEVRKEIQEEFRDKIEARREAIKEAVEKEKTETREKAEDLKNNAIEKEREIKNTAEKLNIRVNPLLKNEDLRLSASKNKEKILDFKNDLQNRVIEKQIELKENIEKSAEGSLDSIRSSLDSAVQTIQKTEIQIIPPAVSSAELLPETKLTAPSAPIEEKTETEINTKTEESILR